MPSEFALIDRYFRRPTRDPVHTALGVGDDCALVRPSPGRELAVSTDMLVAGTHFLPDTDPEALGWKVLAVNVSDLAAMGAQPRWALLAAALPEIDEPWIAAFAKGFFACAGVHDIDVIGGDTTRGPMNFCVTIFGELPDGQALLRSGARPGDDLWVSGHPGRAALGLAHLQGRTVLSEPTLMDCLDALHRPQPRVALGLALRGIATAAIDVSDGLLADIRHILEESKCAAVLRIPNLPSPGIEREAFLAGGDDYELAFAAPPDRRGEIEALAAALQLALTLIGTIEQGEPGALAVLDAEGQTVDAPRLGYDHFA